MDVENVADFPVVSIDVFLDNCDFGRELSADKTTEAQVFRAQCGELLDRLIMVLLDNSCVIKSRERII